MPGPATSLSTLSPEMERLAAPQRLFVASYVTEMLDRMSVNGAALAAAKACGLAAKNSDDKVKSRSAWQQLARPDVAAAVAAETVRLLNVIGPLAIARAKTLLEDPKTPAAIVARISGFVLDKLAPVQVNVEHHHVHEIDHTKAAVEALRFMRSLDVPREKLLQQFGASGLSRYEKLADDEDLQRMAAAKLVEARECA